MWYLEKEFNFLKKKLFMCFFVILWFFWVFLWFLFVFNRREIPSHQQPLQQVDPISHFSLFLFLNLE